MNILEDVAAFRAACAQGQVTVRQRPDNEDGELAVAMLDALGIRGRVLVFECNGIALLHGEGEGCEACDGERWRRKAIADAREGKRHGFRFDTAALLETGRLVVADMALEADIRRELSARWIRRPVEIVECDRANCTLAGARCIGCPED